MKPCYYLHAHIAVFTLDIERQPIKFNFTFILPHPKSVSFKQPMQAIIQSVQAGEIRSYQDSDGKTWESAIDKTPVVGSVEVQQDGLVCDQQADLKHHGGIDKAVLGYSCEHFAQWQDEFPEWSVGAGCFGENLTIAGQIETRRLHWRCFSNR